MDVSGSGYASRVCTTCKARKKRCDKTLPNCGYCVQRGLECHYQKSPPVRKADAAMKDTATRQLYLPTGVADGAASSNDNTQSTDSLPHTISLYAYLGAGVNMVLGSVLCNEVSHVIESAGLSLHDIGDSYFDGFHRWLPIICPEVFRKTVADSSGRARSAEFSVLLLAMSLIIIRPQYSRQQKPSINLKSLYIMVKFYFAQSQSILCASTSLIQAGILIAAYEYACQRPEMAYMSIGTCARMCAISGLSSKTHQARKSQVGEPTFEILEERNVWWGVVVLERLALAEIPEGDHLPVTNFANDQLHLPLDLSHHLLGSIAAQSDIPLLPETHSSNFNAFGRQAQAIVLLDETLKLLNVSSTESYRRHALAKLDERLQSFSALIMGEYRMAGRQCGANATVIRTLLLLHQGALDRSVAAKPPNTGEMNEAGSTSWAALDAAARMMATVASHHVEHIANIDILPICAAYNAQIARKHIEDRRAYMDSESSTALKSLEILENAFRQRWPANETFW